METLTSNDDDAEDDNNDETENRARFRGQQLPQVLLSMLSLKLFFATHTQPSNKFLVYFQIQCLMSDNIF